MRNPFKNKYTKLRKILRIMQLEFPENGDIKQKISVLEKAKHTILIYFSTPFENDDELFEWSKNFDEVLYHLEQLQKFDIQRNSLAI